MAKKSIGASNRIMGHNAERQYVLEFKELGFDKCVTSRYGSRQHDDAAIDLINIPFNVQIKAGKQAGMKPGDVLKDMTERIKDKFPASYPEHNFPKIVIHKKLATKGQKRTEFDEMVFMSFEDFKKIIKKD